MDMLKKMNSILYLCFLSLFFIGACSSNTCDGFLDADERFWCSSVIVTRPGEMGRVNAHPCVIQFDNEQKHIILGEQRFAAILRPGTYEFYAYSTDPYDPDGKNSKIWQSNTVKVHLKPYQTVHYILERVAGPNEWNLRQE